MLVDEPHPPRFSLFFLKKKDLNLCFGQVVITRGFTIFRYGHSCFVLLNDVGSRKDHPSEANPILTPFQQLCLSLIEIQRSENRSRVSYACKTSNADRGRGKFYIFFQIRDLSRIV